jgi:hypothetical protein
MQLSQVLAMNHLIEQDHLKTQKDKHGKNSAIPAPFLI